MGAGTPYKAAKIDESWDAIVIGSGMGGLTTAVLLAQYGGKRVLVLERHYEAGGFTHTFRRPGFEWDVGLHYIGDMEEGAQARRAFDHVTGGAVAWQAMPEVYDRAIFGTENPGGQRFDFRAGRERLRADLKTWFPGEGRAIDKYFAAVKAANRWSGLYYAEKAVPRPVAALAGGLMRAPFLKWARCTTREVLESVTRNRELMGVLTAQWGDYGLPPGASSFAAHATIAQHYFEGGSYPVGGAGAIAAAMTKRLEEFGGQLVTSAEIVEIAVERGRVAGVRMADGSRHGRVFRAPLVASDAGAANTFNRLLGKDVTAVDGLRAQLRGLAASTAHLSLYVGLDHGDAELGLEGTNLWVYPSFDHDQNVERFAHDLGAPFACVYISFPSAKDPDFARRHPGKGTIDVITMVPYARFAGWAETQWKKRGQEYGALKERLAARLRAELERQAPAVVGHIEHAELSTPQTTRHFMNYAEGEIYGVASTPARYALRALGARTPVRGLYLTGQDAVSLGVVGALFGGVVCASAALRKNLLARVTTK